MIPPPSQEALPMGGEECEEGATGMPVGLHVLLEMAEGSGLGARGSEQLPTAHSPARF